MSENEEPFGCFSTAWVYIGYVASFIGLPLAAYLLWDEHRGLAWIAILGVVTGFMPYIGLPVAVGFIVYALTENPARSFMFGIAAIVVAYGPILFAGYFEARKQKDYETSASDWEVGAVGTGHGSSEIFDQRLANPETILSPVPIPVMTSHRPRYCGQCGTPASQDSRFCESCGARLPTRDLGGASISPSAMPPAAAKSLNRTEATEGPPIDVATKNLEVRKLLSLGGRMARKDFIVLSAIVWLAFVPFSLLAEWARTDSCRRTLRPSLFSDTGCSGGEILINNYKYPIFLALLVIWFAIAWTAMVRRSHDFGWSGWVVLILSIIPIVGMIFYAVLFIRRGDIGMNRYGIPNSGTPLPVLHH